jgi:hypothetical protein
MGTGESVPSQSLLDAALSTVFQGAHQQQQASNHHHLGASPPTLEALYDSAFNGPVRASPETLRASSARLRECSMGVLGEMKRLSDTAASGGSVGGASGSGSGGSIASGEALAAFKETVADMARQLEVLRRQEALASLVAEMQGTNAASGLGHATRASARLQAAVGNLLPPSAQ